MTSDRSHMTVISGSGDGESRTAREARERHERFQAKQAERADRKKKADLDRRRLRDWNLAVADRGAPRIKLDTDPDSIRTLTAAINNNILPDTYCRTGAVVSVEAPSGTVATDEAPPLVIVPVDSRRLARLLAQHTFTYEMKPLRLADGEAELVEVEAMPKEGVSNATLAATTWPGLRPLGGIVTAPVFRPDGTLVQEPGYDPVTALIYAPKLPLAWVPDHPTNEQLKTARGFLLDALLHDFPWVGPSRANYIGMLVAPLMRAYLGGEVLTPLGAIDACSAGTGKTLLTLIMTGIYSGYTRAWVADDVELRKAITSILVDEGGGVVVLDNVGKGDVVDQPTLSALLTTRVWSDRILGGSTSARVPNDRVWFVTGNALSIGGDNASRAVPIRLDANMPNPDQRATSKFALGDLELWLNNPTNKATVLHHLLVLMRGWINAGAERIETPMRGFTPWASATAGFLKWLGQPGFMTNRHWLVETDEEETSYGAFYSRWHELFGGEEKRVVDLRASAVPDHNGATQCDWKDTFLVRKRDGQLPSAAGLAKMLSAERGNYRGGYRLNGHYDTHSKTWTYSVTPAPSEEL